MVERELTVPTPSGRMQAFVTHPRGEGPFPAVIVYMDVWGVREELRDIARRIATVGELDRYLRAELARWAKVIKASGAQAN